LAVVDLNLALRFFVGEVGAFLLYKLLRRDFYFWVRLEGILSVVLAFFVRTFVKIVTDFTVSGSASVIKSAFVFVTNFACKTGLRAIPPPN